MLLRLKSRHFSLVLDSGRAWDPISADGFVLGFCILFVSCFYCWFILSYDWKAKKKQKNKKHWSTSIFMCYINALMYGRLKWEFLEGIIAYLLAYRCFTSKSCVLFLLLGVFVGGDYQIQPQNIFAEYCIYKIDRVGDIVMFTKIDKLWRPSVWLTPQIE